MGNGASASKYKAQHAGKPRGNAVQGKSASYGGRRKMPGTTWDIPNPMKPWGISSWVVQDFFHRRSVQSPSIVYRDVRVR